MNYTTIEQSKKLLELGLSPESADMYYGYQKEKPELLPFQDTEVKFLCVPCWSVGSLIKLLPSSIVDKKGTQYVRYSDFDHIEYLTGYWDGGYHFKAFSEFTDNQSLMDILYKCVVWLLENDYIKKK